MARSTPIGEQGKSFSFQGKQFVLQGSSCPILRGGVRQWTGGEIRDGAGCYEFRTKLFLLYERREDGVSCWDGFVGPGADIEFGDPVFILDLSSFDLSSLIYAFSSPQEW